MLVVWPEKSDRKRSRAVLALGLHLQLEGDLTTDGDVDVKEALQDIAYLDILVVLLVDGGCRVSQHISWLVGQGTSEGIIDCARTTVVVDEIAFPSRLHCKIFEGWICIEAESNGDDVTMVVTGIADDCALLNRVVISIVGDCVDISC